MENFIGQDGFVWFTGVVEDRQDPDKLGRVRVRCVGYHTDNKIKIPNRLYVVLGNDANYNFFYEWIRSNSTIFS